jgi:AcrR family transcriptional regulator
MSRTDIGYRSTVSRWEPEARNRLVTAAIELYQERGFSKTTVADIAARAGLTERTYFRYFSDKREVLFSRTEIFEQRLLAAVADVPRSSSTYEAVTSGLLSAAALLQSRKRQSRERYKIISSHTELQERELAKFDSLANALAGVLFSRGVEDEVGRLVSQVAMAVFRSAFERWMQMGQSEELPNIVKSALDHLTELSAVR